MAVGKPNSQRTSKSYTAEVTTKEGKNWLETPHFTFTKKVGSEYPPFTPAELKAAFDSEGPIRDVSGDLVDVKTRPGDFEGKPIHNVSLELVDFARDETVYVKYTIGSDLGRKLTNTILNLTKNRSDVRIGLWGQKNPTTHVSYPAVSIRLGDVKETVKYLLDPKTAPELQPRGYIGEGNKPKKDYTEVDAFLFAEITKFGETLRANPPARQESAPAETTYAASAKTASSVPETAAVGTDGDTDASEGPLPF